MHHAKDVVPNAVSVGELVELGEADAGLLQVGVPSLFRLESPKAGGCPHDARMLPPLPGGGIERVNLSPGRLAERAEHAGRMTRVAGALPERLEVSDEGEDHRADQTSIGRAPSRDGGPRGEDVLQFSDDGRQDMVDGDDGWLLGPRGDAGKVGKGGPVPKRGRKVQGKEHDGTR